MNIDKKRFLGLTVYSVAVLMTMGAGRWTLLGLDARRQEGQHMHAALQMSAMQTMEQMEYNSIANQMEYADVEWHHLQQKAEGFLHQAHGEQEHAKHDALRAQSYQAEAKQNQKAVDWISTQVNTTEYERLALLQAIQNEEQAEHEMLQQIRDAEFSSALCDTRGISYICDLIGGITQLQKEADEMDLQIHRDMDYLDELDRQEYMRIIVVQALQHQAEQYQYVADDLGHAASLWAEQANRDQIEADILLQEAEIVEQKAAVLEHQVHSYESSMGGLTNAVNDMLDDAHRYKTMSIHDFIISLVLLLLPLAVFTSRCVTLFVQVFDKVRSQQNNLKDLSHGISNVVLHFLFFLTTAVACREYLANLDQYSTRTRLIVILYVAFLGAAAQSFWLQALPHTLLEQPWRTSPNHGTAVRITWIIVQMFLMRLMLLLPCFTLEILFLWLSPLCQIVLHPSDRLLYFAYFSLVLGIVVYILSLDPRPNSVSMHSHHDTDDFTVNQEDSEDEEDCVTESTPLKAAAHKTPTDTELFLEMLVVSRMDRDGRDPSHSWIASSQFHVDFPNGLRQLVFFTEAFLLFCVLVILNLNLELLIPSYVRAARIALGSLVAVAYLAWTFHAQQHGTESLTSAKSEFSVKTIDR